MADNTFVFRLQDENDQHDLSNSIKHWGDSSMYDNNQIAAIRSSNIKSLHQPTSIPSPFARIALVKTAFEEVAEYKENALNAYQKIVSDTLDVAEIFFTLDKWKDKVEVIKWDSKTDLDNLKKGHNQLYKTLETFLKNDEEEFNFDSMKGLYILKYKQTGDMIGATSPSTIFFSSGNDLKGVDIQLYNHSAFKEIMPLHKRSWEFQKFLYMWVATYNRTKNKEGEVATSTFYEIVKYLEYQKEVSGKWNEIDGLQQNASNNIQKDYNKLRAPDVEVLGNPIYQAKQTEFLTEEELFEDAIIKIEYKINKHSFFDGNINGDSNNSFLLPIKDKFFSLYTINDLKQSMRINSIGNIVDVTLKMGDKEYKKRYSNSDNNIIIQSFDCSIFPNVKFEDEDLAEYRFGIVYNFKEQKKFRAKFLKEDSVIDPSKVRTSIRNETRSNNFQMRNYSIGGSNFDYIRIYYQNSSGIIIPELKSLSGSNEYKFAIDFGTTNTHIEYAVNGNQNIRTFDILQVPDERQIHYLHGGEEYSTNVFDEEYIPPYTDDEFKLPMRTALSYGENTNWNNVYPFEKASFNELYEKRLDYDYNRTETDLKWSEEANYKEKVAVYIDSIMYMLRNKVIIGNGKLEKTKIIWFYPVSMDLQRFNNLSDVWRKSYNRYFKGNDNNITSITESVAPFEYYIKDGDASNLVTIDIGGGTTDIVISTSGKVEYLTSFRFAANAIFGDGYSENNRVKNGIVRQFQNKIKSELQSELSPDNELFQLFDAILNEKGSADIASFLLSLEHNKIVRADGENLARNANLSKKLVEDTSQKITFIFFYTAIIYHLAQLMKAKKCSMPHKIVFSGNGSRVLNFFTEDEDLLNGYTKLIFERIFETKYSQNNLNIIINRRNPKEATCKGGFYIEEPMSYRDILKKKIVLHSNGTKGVVHRMSEDSLHSNKTDTYSFIDKDYLDKTVEEVKEFIQFVFDILPFFSNEGFDLNKNSIEIAKKVCFKRLDIYVENGWRLKKQEIREDMKIEETLFFYPLIGMLKELADAICNHEHR